MAVHNLSTQPTAFVGRTDELTELTALLANPSCRLLTLVGSGGSGKTRLAIEIAQSFQASFPHDIYFIALQPLTSSDDIVPAIISALNLYLDGSQPILPQLLDYLSRHPMLLVLDNFEHLLDSAGLAAEIVDTAPYVKLLITSREALNLAQEWVRRIEGMRFPSSGETGDIETYSAVQLFVECARRVRGDFALANEGWHVARICQLVEGMPLGIELGAAWLKTLPCDHIADQIQNSLDFLSSPLRNIPERHRSIRAVFDHSWGLLTPDEQAAFRRLSVFRGGFTSEAATAVSGAVLRRLAALVDKSLIRAGGNGRYDIHELLRQYGEEKLIATGEMELTHTAHSAYYMAFLYRRDSRSPDYLYASNESDPEAMWRGVSTATQEIKTDFENIRLAWQWAVEHRHYDAVGLAVLMDK